MFFPKRMPIKCYAARTQDANVLLKSSSGGVFSELARVVLSGGGIVFGAAWEAKTFRVVHKWIDNENQLDELRGSKYAASDMAGVFQDVRRFLGCGREILFVGTPCQVAAVRKVFGRTPHLILCALFCMSNVSQDVWTEYVAQLQKKAKSRLKRVEHRHKRIGSLGSFFLAEFENSTKNFEVPLYSTEYWRLFSTFVRKCCINCQFKGGRCSADIMIGDFWKIEEAMPELGLTGKMGVSAILLYTDIGGLLLSKAKLDLRDVKYEQVLQGNPYLEKCFMPPAPEEFRLCRWCRRIISKVAKRIGLR